MRPEVSELIYRLGQLFGPYESRIAELGREPFLFGRKRWLARKRAIFAEFNETNEAKELTQIREACQHEWGPVEELEWGPFNQRTCQLCGRAKTWMLDE